MALIHHFRDALQIDSDAPLDLEGVFDELAALLAGSENTAFQRELKEAFLKREREGTTAFGFGIAVPHVFHAGLDGVKLAVVRHTPGIDMGACDGVPTRVLICIAAPEDQRQTYLALLRRVAQVVRDPRWHRFLGQSPSAAGIVDILIEAGEGE